jgi:hypothetical protein
MTLHKTTKLFTEWFSVCPKITSKLCTIAIDKGFFKQKNYSNKTSWYVHDLSTVSDFIYLSAVGHELSPYMMECLVFHKNGFTKSCYPLQTLSAYKISWSWQHSQEDLWIAFLGISSGDLSSESTVYPPVAL